MDILVNLTESHDKLDLNISDIVLNISNQITNLTSMLDMSTNMLINYTSDDLICLNDINIERIDNIKYDFINEIRFFIENLTQKINNGDDIDKYIMSELHDILTNQELSILRLDNLLTSDINNYLKETKNIINKFVNTIIDEYKIRDIISNYYNQNNDISIKNFMNQIENNLFPSGDIKIDIIDLNMDIQNKTDFENNLKNRYIDIEITENTDNIFKWNNDIILYEINNSDNTKKIYIYLDLFKREEKIEKNQILDLDISKIFCIINNKCDYNMVYNYICVLIDKYII
jgi:hypothetical protein